MKKSKRHSSVPTTRLGVFFDFASRVRLRYRIALLFCVILVASTVRLTVRIGGPTGRAQSAGVTLVPSLVPQAQAAGAECVIGAFPIVGESLQAAWSAWSRLWAVYICAFGTVKSGVDAIAGWWNNNAENLNKSFDHIRVTKEAMDSVRNITVREAESRSQIRRIVGNLVVNDKDWTKIRFNKIRPETLVLLRDLESFNGQVETMTGRLAADDKKSVPDWRSTRQGVAFENAIKARNDYTIEQAKGQAIQEEFASAERAATLAGKREDGPSTMETYEQLSLPSVHKLLVAQHQTQLLQVELLTKIYEILALERPIDRSPMGRSSKEYYAHRLAELKGNAR